MAGAASMGAAASSACLWRVGGTGGAIAGLDSGVRACCLDTHREVGRPRLRACGAWEASTCNHLSVGGLGGCGLTVVCSYVHLLVHWARGSWVAAHRRLCAEANCLPAALRCVQAQQMGVVLGLPHSLVGVGFTRMAQVTGPCLPLTQSLGIVVPALFASGLAGC